MKALESNGYAKGTVPPAKSGGDSLSLRLAEAFALVPNGPAVTLDNTTLSYAELDARTAALASELRVYGVDADTIVAIDLPRSIELIVAIIATIRAGAAYVPLNADDPALRREEVIAECKPAVLLAENAFGATPCLSPKSWPTKGQAPDPGLTSSTDLAYILYTSGSTGKPNGVMIEHGQVLNNVLWVINHFGFGIEDRFLHKSPMVFDISVWEIFVPLLSSGELVLAPEGAHRDPREILRLIQDYAITAVHFVPTMLNMFLDVLETEPRQKLSRLFTGGEALLPVQRDRVHRLIDTSLHNTYGPTETTVTVSHWAAGKEDLSDPLPIGHPVSNTRFYVLDDAHQQLPPGQKGRLWIAGRQLARGYLNRPDLTAERFVDDPFVPGERMYDSGDMAEQRGDGSFLYHGRADTQIKIRGIRLELGEVEAALEALPGIDQALVVARDDLGGDATALAAFYIGSKKNEAALRKKLSKHLLPHAVPSRIIKVEAFPFTSVGKADRKALATRKIAGPKAVGKKRALAKNTADLIANGLADLLGLEAERLDRDANFFDLGATSLHLIRLREQLQKTSSRALLVSDFFLYSSINAFAGFMDGTKAAPALPGGAQRESKSDLIAIVGMAGRFPGARTVDEFWQGQLEGREMISHFTEDELDFDPRRTNPGIDYVMSRGIMPDAQMFDAKHFGIPPLEADRMDPQHRIMLEVAQTALEDAGHDPDRFSGRIGIFCGSSQSSYLLNNLLGAPGAARELAASYPVKDFATTLGNDKDFLATRLAYKLNLRGPAMTVQTACSTALTAVSQACTALQMGQADMVLAGAVSVTFPTKRPYAYLSEGMASADGHCRTFDAGASGTVFGDGAGLVVLRRLDDALADGDEVIAVIRGVGINNDGGEKAGYAAPSIRAQADAIQAAHRAAGILPHQVGYVEAHGTATPLGDPIEFAALQTVFGSETNEKQFCALSSAKTNIGHLDIAAGIAGLIKTALVLKHRKIPPLLNYTKPNPQIDFENSAFYPVQSLTDWRPSETPRIAGVSAFGVGGTNVHVVLEEAPRSKAIRSVAPDTLRVFPVSGTSPDAVAEAVANLHAFAVAHPEADPDRVVTSLRRGRREFNQRTVLVARDMADLAKAAAAYKGKPATAAKRTKLAFLFPGQGAQHVGMAKHLYDHAPVFRKELARCTAHLERELGLNLLDVIHAPDANAEAMAARLRDTALAQPAIFAVSYALAKQWEHWGIAPDVMVGHSIGEFAAATLSGVIHLRDALTLIALRGRLMADLAPGMMVSVRASEAEIAPYLGAGLDLAAVNGAKLVVIAGPQAIADAILPKIEADGFVVSKLHTSHAFHSQMMEPALAPLKAAIEKITLNPPQVPILSTVTGDWLTDTEATSPDYWANHMRRPVRYYDAIQTLWAEGQHMFLESGPGRTLSTLAAQNPQRRRAQPALASLPHAQADTSDSHIAMLESFGQLWAHGYPVDWGRIDEGRPEAPRLSGLPTYPFQRKRHWVEPVEIDAVVVPPPDDAQGDTIPSVGADPVDAASAVRTMLADLSGVDPVDMDGGATFLELGFDSLLLTQATREISDRFRLTVSLRELIDGHPNIDALAAHIEANGRLAGQSAADTYKPAPADDTERSETPERTQPAQNSAPVTGIEREVVDIDPAQRAHIDKIVQRFNAQTPKSKALTQEYRGYHADPRTAAGFNRLWKEAVYQIVSDRSKGSRIIDVDGNEYIDLLNGFGPGFLGHSNDMVNTAVAERMARGYEVGPQHIEAMQAARLFCEVTGNERASFVCTGSEAVYAAMRLARTVTNRDTIVIFQRDYHGNFDEVLVRGIDGANGPRTLPLTPGIPRDSVKNIVMLSYGTEQSLDWIRKNAASLAAVIVEPVQSRRPEFRPADFIREVRRITERAGALMVFDEVVTGFRFGPRGAQALYGVDADLVTYGKIVGGEMPVGVVAGKARYMDTFDGGHWEYGDDSFPEAPVTFFAGTFVRHPLAMAAVKRVLIHLKSQPELFWRTISAKGDRLAGTMDQWFADNDMPFEMPNCGSMMYLRIGEDQKFGNLIGVHLRSRGVFMLEGFPSYLTAAHDHEDIDFAIEAFKDSALEMRAGGMLTGREASAHDDAYNGPHVTTAPPRLSLPGGADAIAAQMVQPLTPLKVPTTAAQQEIWVAQRLAPELAAGYNENYAIELKGAGINVDLLYAAVVEACGRHDALTACFSADGQEMLFGATAPEIVQYDVSAESDIEASVSAMWDAAASRPFDLQSGPLARFQIIRRDSEAVDLMITAHHIIFDGWSGGTMLRDICRSYDAKIKGTIADLPDASSPYVYAKAERDWMQSAARQAAVAYWKEQFSDSHRAVALPANIVRGADRNVAAAREDIEISAQAVTALRAAARRMGVTLFSLMFAGYKLFVARSASVSDLTVAVPAAGQPVYQLENLVSHCVNLMPVRSAFGPDDTFEMFVRRVSSNVLEASEHQQLTYGSIVRDLNISREASQTPLTSMMFNLDPAFSEAELDFSGVTAEYRSVPRLFSNFEIDLNLSDKGDVIVAEWTYQSALFDKPGIIAFMDSFVDLLQEGIAHPNVSLAKLLSASRDEIAELAEVSFGPVIDIPETSLHDLISAQVAQRPDDTAIESAEGNLSYRELDALSNRLARSLIDHGIKPGDKVGVAVPRGAWAVICMLAALKSGAAYLPLDPNLPENRLRYMVKDSGAAVVLADQKTQSLFAETQATLLVLNENELGKDVTDPAVPVVPTDLAYVLYTSGSTGDPKGVMVSHSAFVNFITSIAQEPGLKPHQRVLALTTLSFDIAGLEIWGPLTQGGTIVLTSAEDVVDTLALIDKVDTCDVIQATPASYHLLLEAGWQGKPDLVALIGGEAVPQDMAAALVERCGEVWNMYGPTETTVWSTLCRLDGGPVRVGRPIANTSVRIIDPETLRQKPPGGVGELLIGGMGLAQGYHNRPDLTEASFVDVADDTGGHTRFYRTGDLARFVRDRGSWAIDVLGRTDSQVKLRGYRIEIGDVEEALTRLTWVSRAVVVLQEAGTPNAHLAAAVICHPGYEFDEQALRFELGHSLPAYMVPGDMRAVETMPLNTSGKVDRRAVRELLSITNPDLRAVCDTAVSAAERHMIDIWQHFFPNRTIGPDDNFFYIGGHSILAASLFDRIRKDMGYDLPIAVLLRNQTPRRLTAALKASKTTGPTNKTIVDDDSDWDTTTVIHLGPDDGHHRPFFIVGGVGGNVNNLFEVGQVLGRRRPVIGFQTRGVMGHRPHETIEAIAAENIRYMRQHQNTGPYTLAGYSGGAYSALEMARQLEAMGEEVDHVIVIDIYAPSFGKKLMQSYQPKLKERLSAELELLRDNGVTTLLRRTRAKLRKVFAPVLDRLRIDIISLTETRHQIMRDVWIRAARKYEGGPINGPITLFTTKPNTVSLLDLAATKIDPTFGWGELTSEQNFQSVELEGDHLKILTGECVERTSAAFEQALAKTTSRVSS